MDGLHLDIAPPLGSVDVPHSLKTRAPLQPRTTNASQPICEMPAHEESPEQQPAPHAVASWPLRPQEQPSEVLKKTRPSTRDGAEKKPATIRHNAVSLNFPFLSRRSPSPAADLPRGRSPSAQVRPSTSHAVLNPPRLVHPSLSSAACVASSPASRPASQSSNDARSVHSASDTSGKEPLRQRRSWLSGGTARLRSKAHPPMPGTESPAWIIAGDTRADYNASCLLNLEKVPELWDDNGSLLVYLSSQQSDKGPSFKVPYSAIEQSPVLSDQVQSQLWSPVSTHSHARSFSGRDTLLAADAESLPSPVGGEARLYLPVQKPDSNGAAPDLDRLVSLRNLFALLTGQPLVGTKAFPNAFHALIQVAGLLREFKYGAIAGGSSSFGEAADLSIAFFVDKNGLADVRFSLDKTLEALVLGEQLRFWPLYNEAFCHAVGKYAALRDHKSPLWNKVSHSTLQRLERANLDLLSRQQSVNTRLEQFEFPSLFSGVGNSTSNPDYRNIRFKMWRASFSEMRSFTLKYYKTKFGSWPPKAGSKRNTFTESGLNRLVLQTLYADLCAVYDLLVDRRSITTRVGEDGLVSGVSASAAKKASAHHHKTDPTMMALRQMLSEFDTSSPPVLPPIPFDVPKLPAMASINAKFPDMPPKDQARFEKHISPSDLQLLVLKSHNTDAEPAAAAAAAAESSFLAAFEAFELHEARGKTEMELAEMRIGHWLFLYVVLQSLPMLVIDAPGLRFRDGTEYFLCEPLQGYPPWVEDAGEVRKAWFQTAGGTGPLVQLSADVLLYSVEATHHRSHCWVAAKEWEAEAGLSSAPGAEDVFDIASFGIPPPIPASVPTSRPGSAAGSYAGSYAGSAGGGGSGRGSGSNWPLEPAPELTPPATAQSPTVADVDGLYPPRSRSASPRTDEQWERARQRHASTGWNYLADPNVVVAGEGDPRDPLSRRAASVNNLRTLQEEEAAPSLSVPSFAVHAPEDVAGGSSGASIKSTSAAAATGEHYNAESTFDAILGPMDDGKKKKTKRASFLPF